MQKVENTVDSRPCIYFITTYKARDFEGNALVGYLLEKQYGFRVEYMTQYYFEQKIIAHKPVAVILDHLAWNHKIAFLKFLRALNIAVILYPTEGYYEDMAYMEQILGKRFIPSPLLDQYLLWGTDMRDYLFAHPNYKAEQDKMTVTGHARFDYLLNPKLRHVAGLENLRSEFDVPEQATVVTYMSTFSYQGYDFDDFNARYGKNANFTLGEVRAIYEDQQKLFKNHVTLIKQVAEQLGDSVFLFFKTHPAEKYIDNYAPYFGHLKNVAVIKDRDVKPFLFYSDYIIQRNCTTATETWMFGKQTIQLVDDQYMDPSWAEHETFSQFAKNAAEVVGIIQGRQTHPLSASDLTRFLMRKFGPSDGLAHERVAAAIAKTLEGRDFDATRKSIDDFKQKFERRPAARLRRLLRLPVEVPLKPKYFLSYLTKRIQKQVTSAPQAERDISTEEVLQQYEKIKLYL
jgi:surface carbohydrate biosynthesis protein